MLCTRCLFTTQKLRAASIITQKLLHTKQPASIILQNDTNQAIGLAQYAYDFLNASNMDDVDPQVLERVEMFHTDSVLCGISALALGCNAPTVLRNEAISYQYESGACVFGSDIRVRPEKAALANSSAVREWDSNGTVFGYNKNLGIKHQAGEFGHNDFYPVIVAAAQQLNLNGVQSLRAMLLHDEIRGRFAEVFSLKSYKIDHVVHGAIATAIVYGTLLGASIEQIESAVGMVICHYIPFRAIRAGHQLSDSKGASAAISTEVAIICVHRSMNGFIGAKDIFRNPQSIFRLNEPTKNDNSPFNIVLSNSGNDFSVMGMHFKLGLYEHQSAGAIQATIDAILQAPEIIKNGTSALQSIAISIYEPAFSIIGDPSKKNPTTRQSADHSMVYIIASHLRRAFVDIGYDRIQELSVLSKSKDMKDRNMANTEMWKEIMLLPLDYSSDALYDRVTREIMGKIEFIHGGQAFDDKYPDGIPTKLMIKSSGSNEIESDLVMYPSGHARNVECDLKEILTHKWQNMAGITIGDCKRRKNNENNENDEVNDIIHKLSNLKEKSPSEMQELYNIPIKISSTYIL